LTAAASQDPGDVVFLARSSRRSVDMGNFP
jgi:hypothetical protein